MTNPFIINGDIPSEYFCDRKEESKKLIQMLTNGENVCLMSPRRMGKSKLIQFCYDQEPLCSDHYCFYIDIFHTTSLREFTYTFGRQVFSTLRSKSQKMTLWFVQALKSLSADFGFDPSTGMPKFSLSLGDVHNPEFTLEEIFKALEQADKPCIVCFDEFQQIANYPEKNIEALLRGHIQHLGNANFIFSGSSRHLITQMFYSYARPFYNSTTSLTLDAISLEEYTKFTTYWFNQFSKQIEPQLIAQIYQVMERNTYYIHKTLHELFENT
ncbi:MAG: ATP-binding protein, partial [Bacteroidales bacterium]|nr:ATP-binding protein [Bacteroidales bacterium]